MNRSIRFVCLSLAALSLLSACQSSSENSAYRIPETTGEDDRKMKTFAQTLTGVGVFPAENQKIDVVYVYRLLETQDTTENPYVHRRFETQDTAGNPQLYRVVLSGTLDSQFVATLTSSETTNDTATITCTSATCETGVLELTKKAGVLPGTATVNFSRTHRTVVAEQAAQTAGDDAAAQLAQAFNNNSIVNNMVSTYEVVDGLAHFFSVKVNLANDTAAGIRGATGSNVSLTVNFEGAQESNVRANVSIDATKTLVVDFAPGSVGLQSLRATPQ